MPIVCRAVHGSERFKSRPDKRRPRRGSILAAAAGAVAGMLAPRAFAAPGVALNGSPPVAATLGVPSNSTADFVYDPATGDLSFIFGSSFLTGTNFVTTLWLGSTSGMLLFQNVTPAVKNSTWSIINATQIEIGTSFSPGIANGLDFGLILPANLTAGALAVDLTIGSQLSGPGYSPPSPAVSLVYPGVTALPVNVFNGASGNWSDGSRWSLGRPPRTGDVAQLSATAGATLVAFDAPSSGIVLSGLNINATGAASVTLSQALGTLQINGNEVVGDTGNGAVIQSGGTHIVTGTMTIGNALGSNGSYTLTGGSLGVGRREWIGRFGTAVFNQNGGSNTTSSLDISANAGASATYNLSAGSLSAAGLGVGGSGAASLNLLGGTLTASYESIGGGGTGTAVVNQSGGAHLVTRASYPLSASLTLAALSSYNLSSGTLKAGVQNMGSFSFTGGTLSVYDPKAGQPMFDNKGGTFLASGAGTRVVDEPFSNSGTVIASKTIVQFPEGFTNNGTYLSQQADNYFGGLAIGESNTKIVAGPGDRFFISGDFYLQDQHASRVFQVDGAEFHFIGGGIHEYRGATSGTAIPVMILDPGNTLEFANGIAATIVNQGHVRTAVPAFYSPGGTTFVSSLIGPGDLTVGSPTATTSALLTVGTLNQSAATIGNLGILALGPGTQTSTLGSLAINPGGKVDLNQSTLLINYGTNATPLPQVRSWLATGSGGSNHLWRGTGLTSTFVAKNQPKYGIGYTEGADRFINGVTPGQLLIRPTLYGDVNFDGKVDAADINQITARGHYNDGTGNHAWIDGDMNYDGFVNTADMRIIALSGNYPGMVSLTAAATGAAASTPSFQYDAATGDVTLVTNGVANIADLHLRSAAGMFLAGNSTFSGIVTQTQNELENVRLDGRFTDGYDMGNILPMGLSTAAAQSDVTVSYGVSGAGVELAAILTPEPTSLSIIGVGSIALLGRRRRRRSVR